LTSLSNLEQIGNILTFDNVPNLSSLDGLDNLDTINSALVIFVAPNLSDLSALSGLRQLGGLTFSLTGVEDLTFLRNLENDELGGLSLTGNSNLRNLNGLENILTLTRDLTGPLSIAGNPNLEDLTGLRNLRSVVGDFTLSSNASLNDCCTIANLINADAADGFVVEGNITISDNANLCSSVEAILQNCQSPPSLSCTDINIQTTPTSITVSNLLAPIEIVKVFDANFQTIYECFADCEETITVTDLAAGRYHLGINFYDENWQDICELIQTVQVGISTQDRNTNFLPADFALYPNPAATETFIDLSKLKGETIQLALFNQFGQKIKEQIVEKVTAEKEKIDLTTLQNGVYILQIKADGKRPIAKKLMVTQLY